MIVVDLNIQGQFGQELMSRMKEQLAAIYTYELIAYTVRVRFYALAPESLYLSKPVEVHVTLHV